ncbi:MAG: hypothetical protein DWQ01_12900 [Planctomycetota bacterium]|nr:MAG: hypothetical protein DWQ01_12900 [Planctomycetota bacterium]
MVGEGMHEAASIGEPLKGQSNTEEVLKFTPGNRPPNLNKGPTEEKSQEGRNFSKFPDPIFPTVLKARL